MPGRQSPCRQVLFTLSLTGQINLINLKWYPGSMGGGIKSLEESKDCYIAVVRLVIPPT